MKLLYFICFSCLFVLSVKSQDITGHVFDTYGESIENAFIINNNSYNHSHSLDNGKFTIDNNKIGDTLKVTILGYKSKIKILESQDFENDIVFNLEESIYNLDQIIISNQPYITSTITKLDLELNPVNSSQEVLQKVPGLIIGQHAGGGKAEQLFLRGFDIDHGTDIQISVDGMPVNMVSHAHGQGYSDLHFVIPETIDYLDFNKGPYNASKGDFATAGYVDFKTKDKLDHSTIQTSIGQYNHLRTLGLFNLINNKNNQNSYVGVEYIANDGPYESPQNFNRINVFAKYTTLLKNNAKLSFTASYFDSRWNASGQIPEREVKNGNISRFGAIDDTEGGNTSRTNINLDYKTYINEEVTFKSSVFYSKYDFELFSNFTFFLDDPINGDQIRQKEDRTIFGFNSQFENQKTYGNVSADYTTGFGLKYDLVDDIELSHTLNRKTILNYNQLGNLRQTNAFSFFKSEFEIGKFKIAPEVRLDYFKFIYEDLLEENYTISDEEKSIISPKLNFFYNQNEKSQWFLKTGIGFHSNDARVVVNQKGKDILPKAYGVDLGNIWKPNSKLIVNSTLWYLFSDQEFVYVGDAGIVEPNGESERFGVDLGFRFQINDYLYLNTDATYTHARSVNEVKGRNYIPLAPDFTMAGGISFKNYNKLSGNLNFKYLDDRPANEDNSIVAKGYFITNASLSYNMSNNINIGMSIENLFDLEWNETQFATESRLQNETESVEEIHFTPGTPFNFKMILSYTF